MLAGLFLAGTACADAPQTWQDANKESARIIREQGSTREAADLARSAYDLYGQQSPTYNAKTHAQLLLNLVGARRKVEQRATALAEFVRGVEEIAARVGNQDPILLDLWQEALTLAAPGSHQLGRYYMKASDLAEKLWGAEDLRSVKLEVQWAMDLRARQGYPWARSKLRTARSRADAAGAPVSVLNAIDLNLAKLEAERGHTRYAIELYESLIARLEPSQAPDDRIALQTAYALLEVAYQSQGKSAEALAVRQKLIATFDAENHDELKPLVRVAPRYPRRAALSGRTGYVDLMIVVGPNGSVIEAKTIRADPQGVFEDATLEAVRRWTFAPKIVDGKAVEQRGVQRFEFGMR